MDLKQFVSDTLQQILEGVREASQAQRQHDDGGQVNPHTIRGTVAEDAITHETKTAVRLVEFDVAVTIDKNKETKGGVLAVVGAFNLGSSGASKSANSTVSRIKFTVPLGLPRP